MHATTCSGLTKTEKRALLTSVACRQPWKQIAFDCVLFFSTENKHDPILCIFLKIRKPELSPLASKVWFPFTLTRFGAMSHCRIFGDRSIPVILANFGSVTLAKFFSCRHTVEEEWIYRTVNKHSTNGSSNNMSQCLCLQRAFGRLWQLKNWFFPGYFPPLPPVSFS